MRKRSLGNPLYVVFSAVLSTGSGLTNPEVVAVTRLLRATSAANANLVVLEANQLAWDKKGRLARELLEDAEREYPESAAIQALLAMILAAQRDPAWESYARTAQSLQLDGFGQEALDRVYRAKAGLPAAVEGAGEPGALPAEPTLPAYDAGTFGIPC